MSDLPSMSLDRIRAVLKSVRNYCVTTEGPDSRHTGLEESDAMALMEKLMPDYQTVIVTRLVAGMEYPVSEYKKAPP